MKIIHMEDIAEAGGATAHESLHGQEEKHCSALVEECI